MRKKKLLFLFILIPFILLSTIIYIKDKNVPVTISKFENFLYDYEDFKEELPVHFSEDCNSTKKKVSLVSKSQAREDIDNLFSLLKFGYSGYSFFGGDEKFNDAKLNILDQINANESKNISTDLLITIISEHLNFVQDSHFAIDNQKLCKYTKYFSSKDYEFQKDSKGFYTLIEDEIYYLDKINYGDA